jgi:hypothetical protein
LTLDGRGRDLDLVLGADLTQDAGRHAGTDDDAAAEPDVSAGVIGSPYSQPARRSSGSMGCVAVSSWTHVAIWQAAPIVIGATSSITASTLTNVPSPLLISPHSQWNGGRTTTTSPTCRSVRRSCRVALVPGARRGPVELGQPLLDASELGLVVGVLGDVQRAAQRPLSHLAHPACRPLRVHRPGFARRARLPGGGEG